MHLLKAFAVATIISTIAFAQESEEPSIEWLDGPGVGTLSSVSTLKVPEGYSFTGPEGTRVAMLSMGNPLTDTEIGLITSSNGWIAVFEFDRVGYVKDDEKDSLDADALMQSFIEGEKSSNERRLAMGGVALETTGWYKKPFYNEQTQNLEWCTKLREVGTTEEFANHNIRILGRHGVTRITLVADIPQLDSAIPELANILEGYAYQPGGTYAEYRKGDKVAKYGLTALVAGGAAVVALKSGLFKHIWKFLVIGGAAIASFFKKIFKRKNNSDFR